MAHRLYLGEVLRPDAAASPKAGQCAANAVHRPDLGGFGSLGKEVGTVPTQRPSSGEIPRPGDLSQAKTMFASAADIAPAWERPRRQPGTIACSSTANSPQPRAMPRMPSTSYVRMSSWLRTEKNVMHPLASRA